VITFREPVDEDELNAAATRLNNRGAGFEVPELRALTSPASTVDETIVHAVIELMEQESDALGDVFRDGVREVLSQPEFARSERILDLIDVLEQRTLSTAIPIRQMSADGINVVIGSENSNEAMRECSIVVARYGVDGGPSGVVAVLGPTRMRYARTIPTVRFLASVLGDLITRL
jgi:heat-inducible transcriptional repressor